MENDIIEIKYAMDTFYFLISGVLVMWMAAGFTMLEAGLVRSKNTTEILAKNVALYSIACVMYLIMGYTVMYGGISNLYVPDGFFGISAANSTAEEVLASGGDTYYSGASDFFFQVVFVATAMSIVSGAVAERMKLWAFLAFAVVMTGFIYPMQGSWSWGGGFLGENIGYSDYAGSGIVHLCGAAAALAGVLILGPRIGKYSASGESNAMPGANMPLATIGMFILWMGWFGFNGGSELAVASIDSSNNVASVFMNTNTAAASGLIAALITSQIMFGKADLTMALNGALAGLVAITADPLSPSYGMAMVIGAIGGVIVVFSVLGLDSLKIDDPVGAISVHGTVGIWGLIAVCIAGEATLGGQIGGALIIFAWTFITAGIVFYLIDMAMGIRVSEEDELKGIDTSECGIEAYPEFTSSS
ncbi:MAG: ammonium transporter [Porticoccaceae bacterium]|nr:ammonium transporter [Porticoccaceae bacterium]|tara:strand:- start:214 stop:1464 length:1251 start_codon:yes stop_codon:yes gene_type:complete